MKNLFKVFGIIALVAVIGFSFSACSGKDDGGNNGGGGSYSGPLLGKWYISQEYADFDWKNSPYADNEGNATMYEFNSDGTISIGGTKTTNTFTATANTLTMNNNPASASYSISGNVLTITVPDFSATGWTPGNYYKPNK